MASVYFDPAVGGNGSTVSDDSNPTTGLANGGHRTRFVPALGQVVAVADFIVDVASSALNAPGTSATSSSTLTIGTGTKTLTIQTGKAFAVGQYLVIANTSAVTNYVAGQITAYDPATGILTVNATETNGSGTYSNWTVALSAPGGITPSGTQTLTNKTIALGNNSVSGTTAQFNAALTDDDFATLTNTGTLTNKTIALGDNSISGTVAEFNAALTDGDFATLSGTEALSNKTLESAVLNNGYTEEVFALTGTTPALSPNNGSFQTWTLTGNSTPTLGTWADGQSMTLSIDDGTAFSITWTSVGVNWKTNLGAAPTLNLTTRTMIVLWEIGGVIYGARVGDA